MTKLPLEHEFMRTPLHEHLLQQVDPWTVYPEYGGKWKCDNCRRENSSESHPFHCSQCNFDLCHTCISASVYTNNIKEFMRTPLHEHPLQQVDPKTVYGGRGFNCDNCGIDYDSSHHPFHCIQCNFDLCHICASVYTNNIKEKQTSPAVKKQGVVSVDGAPSTSRPEVFISYQWGSQGVVLELKQRLEKNGIHCWMDIGQMGGGDALFKEIDAGISASKVVICCVTQKYCQSENCQREATLADCRKKAIIPLLFEEITWPPTGQLALVFAKLLYIKMVPCLEAVRGNKFNEILQKIQGHISK